MIALVAIVAGIRSDIERNCNATADLGGIVTGIVAVDNELNKPKNENTRTIVIRHLRQIEDRCK